MSGQWDLAANGASETRNRTQDAGDIVHFVSIETGCTIVVVNQTETREIQELLICSRSIALDDFDYRYFCPNNAKVQERPKSLIRGLNIGILGKVAIPQDSMVIV